MTKILCDFHHGGLMYSLHLLFEKRLGYELYIPCGLEWYKEKMWGNMASESDITAHQYLNWNKEWKVYEGSTLYTLKGITLDEAKQGGIDYIISSVPKNDVPFASLKKWNKDAVLISQWGNPHQTCNFDLYKNVLNSTMEAVPQGINNVYYHQEFDLKEFCYTEPPVPNRIRSFVMYYGQMDPTASTFRAYKKAMPDFDFKMYGWGDDGIIPEEVKAQGIKDASFIWHVKKQGDGYGHSVHGAYACGRPVITIGSFFKGMPPSKLFTPDTAIDLEKGTAEHNIAKIREWSADIKNVSKRVRAQFDRVVNFDEDEQKVRAWLKRCI